MRRLSTQFSTYIRMNVTLSAPVMPEGISRTTSAMRSSTPSTTATTSSSSFVLPSLSPWLHERTTAARIKQSMKVNFRIISRKYTIFLWINVHFGVLLRSNRKKALKTIRVSDSDRIARVMSRKSVQNEDGRPRCSCFDYTLVSHGHLSLANLWSVEWCSIYETICATPRLRGLGARWHSSRLRSSRQRRCRSPRG